MSLEVNQRVVDMMTDRVMSLKKITATRDNVQKCIVDILNYVNYFNSLSEYDTRVLNNDFESIPILKEFEEFLIPASIKTNASDLNCVELLIKPEVPDNVSDYNLADYLDAMCYFRALFKKDLSENMSNLSAYRKNVSISEVMQRCMFTITDEDGSNYNVLRYEGKVPFVPYHVQEFISRQFKDRYFNATAEEVLIDFAEIWLI